MYELHIWTTELVEDESLSHLSKLGCRETDCIDPICNHVVYKAVNEKRRNVLDEAEMFPPATDFVRPVNFLRKERLDATHISEKLASMGPSVGNIPEDFTVSEVIPVGEV